MNKMRSIKVMSVNRVLGSLKKRTNGSSTPPDPAANQQATQHDTTPEKTAHNSVKAFIEAGGSNSGDDVLFLPPIVESAESSPAAAAECARLIRKYLHKEFSSRPSWQYNAIMLVRILTDNPGETFTRNMDQKIVDSAQALLRGAKDPRVRQILMETLDDFERTRGYDTNLEPIVKMWQKEKEKALKQYGGRLPPPVPQGRPVYAPAPVSHSQNYFSRHHHNTRMPDPVELASRLEEARTSAKLLEQVVMNTPPGDFLGNELIKEFADRCQSASRSIQGYMVSENPAPDNDTMENLIDTNEQLQTALNQHRRALLSARKQMGLGERTESDEAMATSGMAPGTNAVYGNSHMATDEAMPPPMPSRKPLRNGKGKATAPFEPSEESLPDAVASGSGQYNAGRAPKDEPADDPFADPFRDPNSRPSGEAGPSTKNFDNDTHMYEPFNPGFSPAMEKSNQFDNQGMANHSVPRSEAKGGPGGSSHRNLRDISDDDDMYAASPKVTEPASRY